MSDDIPAMLQRTLPVDRSGYDPVDVERRARRLRRKRTVTRAVAGGTLAVGMVAAAAAVAGVLDLGASRSEQGSDGGSAPTSPADPEPEVFVPATRQEAGRTVMPVTFPDGTTAEIVYPRGLDIASLGVHPYGSGALVGPGFDGCCARDFTFAYGDASWLARAGPPIREFPGFDGRPVLLVPWSGGPLTRYLVFQIGPWRLGVWDDGTMTDDQLAAWAEHLQGRLSADGFPILTGSGPLRLTGPSEGLGPALGFGDPDRARQLSLQLRACDRLHRRLDDAEGPEHSASLCRPEWSTWVNVTGDPAFVETITRELEIRNVQPAAGSD